ncbi:MAG: winged helix-turn-helix transcriptional regulator [Rubrivivax sp.]|nr:winged helix-turn-helix transcriptional regulator [Rubrivivax sp.]
MPRKGLAAASIAAEPQAPVRVLRQFRRVFNAVRTHFQQVERHAGLGGAQLWALSRIEAQPGIGVGALAAAMDIHQTTASNLVRALLDEGLVESRREGPDRRAVQLHALPAGRQLLAQAPGPMSGVLPDALARLNPDTLARLENDLDALLALLDTDEDAAQIPLAQM